MIKINEIIELKTNSDTKRLSLATRYLVQINFTFDLSVISKGFAGTSHFCIRIDQIEKLCNDLAKMHSTLSGNTNLDDNDSDAFVRFEIESTGKLYVIGQVGGTHEEHFVRYKFQTDQSCIPYFISDLKKLLIYRDNKSST